jgi:outer membrane lipoprotein SlyB
MRASLVKVIEGSGTEDAKRVGAGAVVGGIIGGMLGGGKGALAGVMIGAGGTVAATEGSNAELPVGTILRIRLDQPLEVTIR